MLELDLVLGLVLEKTLELFHVEMVISELAEEVQESFRLDEARLGRIQLQTLIA